MGWRSSWEGLWRRRPGVYVSRICSKKEIEKIPGNFRLIIKENKNHINNNSKTPRFVFSFCDEEEQKAIMLKTEEPVLRNELRQLAEEYKRMASVAVNFSEKEFAKRLFMRKLLVFMQRTTGEDMSEVMSLCREKAKNSKGKSFFPR